MAFVSTFDKRCFLRRRCSMEMWCPDGGSSRRIVAKENGATPDWIVVFGVVVVSSDTIILLREADFLTTRFVNFRW